MSHFHIHIKTTARKPTPPYLETTIHLGLSAGTFCSASFLDDLHHAPLPPFSPSSHFLLAKLWKRGGGRRRVARISSTASYCKLLFYWSLQGVVCSLQDVTTASSTPIWVLSFDLRSNHNSTSLVSRTRNQDLKRSVLSSKESPNPDTPKENVHETGVLPNFIHGSHQGRASF